MRHSIIYAHILACEKPLSFARLFLKKRISLALTAGRLEEIIFIFRRVGFSVGFCRFHQSAGLRYIQEGQYPRKFFVKK